MSNKTSYNGKNSETKTDFLGICLRLLTSLMEINIKGKCDKVTYTFRVCTASFRITSASTLTAYQIVEDSSLIH